MPNSWIACWQRWPDALGILWCKSQHGPVTQVRARLGTLRRSRVRWGGARAAMAARRACGPSLPPSLVDMARCATAWRGAAGLGLVRRDTARVTDGGTEAPASLPPSRGWTRWCQAARASARTGRVRHGLAWLGYGCRQQHGASTEAPCCSLRRADLVRPGMASMGRARACLAMRGEPWHGPPTAAR